MQKRKSPLVLYLDTQDYSRFGDVLRGVASSEAEKTFVSLEKYISSGDVICAMSMPVLSELLQYDINYRETTLKKAEAVERLCGPWALACPNRLIAYEVASAYRGMEFNRNHSESEVLSSDRYWYPNISGIFDELDQRLKKQVDIQIKEYDNLQRWQRRQLKRAAKNIDMDALSESAALEVASEYGLPVDTVAQSLGLYLKKKISSAEASRKLFGAIAEPQKFVEMYFEKIETDRDALPAWMRSLGLQMESIFVELREQILPITSNEEGRRIAREAMEVWSLDLGSSVLRLGQEDAGEFDLSLGDYLRAIESKSVIENTFSPLIFGNLIVGYVQQIAGITSRGAKIERSFGGDLMHALYMPYVDLWRGDRRFSNLSRSKLPQFSSKVVNALTEIPGAIEGRLTGPAES